MPERTDTANANDITGRWRSDWVGQSPGLPCCDRSKYKGGGCIAKPKKLQRRGQSLMLRRRHVLDRRRKAERRCAAWVMEGLLEGGARRGVRCRPGCLPRASTLKKRADRRTAHRRAPHEKGVVHRDLR